MKYINILCIFMKDGVTKEYNIKNRAHALAILVDLACRNATYVESYTNDYSWVGIDEKDIDTELLNKLMKHVIED